MACILLWSSFVRAHESQAYRKMDVTGEYMSPTFELREIFLSLQTVSTLPVFTAMHCVLPGLVSGLITIQTSVFSNCTKVVHCVLFECSTLFSKKQ